MYSAKTGQFHHIYTLKLEDKKATRLTAGVFNDIEPDVTSRLRPSTAGKQPPETTAVKRAKGN